ncbi:unnamed protein product, partial [Rotaria magnacalcarata]
SSNYPYPQYNNNGTTPYVPSTFPGQLPPMPYPMGGNTNGANNQQMNGPTPVKQ